MTGKNGAVSILRCPACAKALKEVFAKANYGRVLLLDQCTGCGGVWFDRWELYMLHGASVSDLDSVDVSSLNAPNPDVHGSDNCPRCSLPLVEFRDPGLPPDASIRRCVACSGLWLNRGEISKYANHRDTFKKRGTSEAAGADIETLRHLQKELDLTKITGPAPEAAGLASVEPPLDTKEIVTDLGFLALQTLVRLLFKI
ncbi:MAG: zf-TFIIB domain-containing protein [Deltaproteobacteria bacterium]